MSETNTLNNKIQHIKDSAHWYTAQGEPCFEIEGKNGVTRAPDIRDARARKLLPSVTSYSKIISKPQLTNWIVNGVLEIAAKTPRLPNEQDFEWIQRVSDLSQAERDKPAQRGTAIHAMIEDFLTTGVTTADPVGSRACRELREWLDNNSITDLKSEIPAANAREGVAGRIDILLNGDNIADIKTTAKPPRTPWAEWGIQLAGYCLCLGIPPGPAYSLVINSQTGELIPMSWGKEEICESLETFKKIRDLWIDLKHYDPRQ